MAIALQLHKISNIDIPANINGILDTVFNGTTNKGAVESFPGMFVAVKT